VTAALDLERLVKVAALMRGGATDGERAAARAAAERVAAAAGLTLDEAMSELDRAEKQEAKKERNKEQPRREDFWSWDDWMEARQPGHKARVAAEMEERARQQAERRRRVLAEWGSAEAVFAETERERLLRAAVEPLAVWKTYRAADGSTVRYIASLAGWCNDDPIDRMPASVRAAVTAAYAWPDNLVAALSEHFAWDRLLQARRDVRASPDTDPAALWAHARVELLMSILNTMPIRRDFPLEDMAARMEWRRVRAEIGWAPINEEDEQRLRDDLAILREAMTARPAAPVQTEHPAAAAPITATERRRLIIDALRSTPDASDREIARRFAASPSTVGAIRKRLAEDVEPPLFRRAAA